MTPVPDNRRFYHGKSPHPFRNLCLSLLIFVVICGLFSVGITRISNRTRQEQKNSLEHALWRGVTQYYALEGRYPETLQDLKDTCGIRYDTDLFFCGLSDRRCQSAAGYYSDRTIETEV